MMIGDNEIYTDDQKLKIIASAGCVISLCYGPMGKDRVSWSVQVLSSDGVEFEKPFAADSMSHAISIGYQEADIRGWLDETVKCRCAPVLNADPKPPHSQPMPMW